MKTIELKVPDEINLIDAVHKMIEKSKHTWSDDNNTLSGKLGGGKATSVCPETQDSGVVLLKVDTKAEKEFNKIKKILTQKITTADINKTVFKGIPLQNIKNGIMALGDNLSLLKEIDGLFKPLAKQCFIYTQPEKISGMTAFDDLHIIFQPYHGNMMDSMDFNYELFKKYKELDGYHEPSTGTVFPEIMANEEVEDIKVGEFVIGKYFKHRNMIIIFFNPFKSGTLRDLYELKDSPFLSTILSDIVAGIKAVKPKQQNQENFKLRLMVSAFNQNSKQKIRDLKYQIKDMDNQLKHLEESLTNTFKLKNEYKEQLKGLDTVEENQIERFVQEIEKVKKQKIITDVNTNGGTINITFKPTTVKGKIDRNVEGIDNGKLVECFVGQITVHIHGDGKIITTCDHPTLHNNAHPHSRSDENTPCLGSGEGANLIHKLIGEKKFSDFIYVFWMWIKKWRNEDCYVHVNEYLDDRLKQGLPVFDQAGNRVEINDPEWIKDGSLIRLDKHPNYEKNKKKYADFKPQR